MEENKAKQAIFTYVVTKAMDMHKKSVGDDHGCLYYNAKDGNKCFIGHIIPKDRYDKTMEKLSLMSVFRSLSIDLYEDMYAYDFLCDLQNIHDWYEINEWHKKFKEFALKYDLELPSV